MYTIVYIDHYTEKDRDELYELREELALLPRKQLETSCRHISHDQA